MQGELKYHWLIAGNVIASGPKGQMAQRGLNTMIRTAEAFFTRGDLATAQDGLMRRFLEETDQSKAGKIVDVFILSISPMGLMTAQQFNGPFAEANSASAMMGSKELD